ncbi:hypothetical protein KC726_03770 [Candidatus Woesebacteria bacterium]|nr:hypothetical protein [Candidatus Woesebacteria bacterium]
MKKLKPKVNMKKLLIIICLFVLLFGFGRRNEINAQDQSSDILNEFIDIIGSGGDIDSPTNETAPDTNSNSPVGITQIETNSDIIKNAELVSANLELGSYNFGLSFDLYNRNVKQISNQYHTTPYREGAVKDVGDTGLFWCTNMVISSYSLSGYLGMGANEQGVQRMMDFWRKPNDQFIFFDHYAGDKQTNMLSIKPGCAFFMERTPGLYDGQHTGIVYTITVDSHGNGSMTTLESNSSNKINKYTIKDYDIPNLRDDYKMTGFGCIGTT